MHNVKQASSQDNSAVKRTELPAGEELHAQPFQGEMTITGKLKMPRGWRYMLAGGTVLLVLAVILAGVLSSRSQSLKQPVHSVPLPVPTAITGSIYPRSIAAPKGKPIVSPVWSNHNVSVTIVDGVAYAGTYDNTAYALRVSNGTLLWHTRIEGAVGELPLVVNGVVYVNSFVGQIGPAYLSALRASDGHQLWSRAIDATFDQSPQIIDGVIYLVATKISLETPTARSTGLLPQAMVVGTLLWSNGQAATLKETTPLKATMPLKSGKSTVYAIRASDGTVLWQYPMNNGRDSFAGWLKVENGVVYTSAVVPGNSANTGYISALQSTDGKVLWQDKIDGSPSGALLTDGVIYASVDTTNNSAVYALRAHDGTLIWGLSC
jgi:outer membrane protein assembly factor BamB